MKYGMLLATAMGIAAGNALLAPQSAFAANDSTAVVVLHETYAAGDQDGTRILQWISLKSPDYTPIKGNAEVRVERMTFAKGSRAVRAATARAGTPSPPNGLPDTGQPGEVYKVESILPDGTTQSWEYRWESTSSGHGESWVFVAYAVRIGGVDPVEIK